MKYPCLIYSGKREINGVYIYDLLVRKAHTGNQIGKLLMEQACRDFPDQSVYVMSDVDVYYEKLGYMREGTIFEVIAL
jgi:GNAT superfamily N-acetyltransferase